MTDQELQAAIQRSLPEPPARCHHAFMSALHAVKEDEPPMKRNILRTVMLAMMVLCLTVSAALAVDAVLNQDWQDITSQPVASPTDTIQPEELQPVSGEPTALKTWEVGPVTVTLLESSYDDQYLYQTIRVSMTDGSRAVLMPAGNAVNAPIRIMEGVNPWSVAESTSFLQTARRINVPLYCITMTSITIPLTPQRFNSPKYGVWSGDGSITMTSSIQLPRNTEQREVRLYLRVSPIDLDSGTMNMNDDWKLNDTVAVIHAIPQSICNYAPDSTTLLRTTHGDVILRGVHLELLPTRAYLYTVYERQNSAESSLAPLIYTTSYTTLQGKQLQLIADGSYGEYAFDDLYITRQAYALTDAPEALVLFDTNGLLGSDPIVLRPVDYELANQYCSD